MTKADWITGQKDSTSSLGISTVIWIYRLLGRRCAYALVWCITLVVIISNPGLRHRSEVYLKRIRRFAEKRGIELKRLTPHRHIFRFATGMLEKMLAWKGLLKADDMVSVNNSLERLRELDAKKKSHVIISSHIGDIELLRAINNFLDQTTLNIILETENNRRFMEYLRGVNQNSGINIIPVSDITPATVVKLQESLARGEWLAVLGDRLNSTETRSMRIDFLDGRADFPVGPWIMASILNAPVCIIHTIISDGRRKLYMKEIGRPEIRRKSRDKDLRRYISGYAELMEELLLEAPLDWFNFYDFWQEGDSTK